VLLEQTMQFFSLGGGERFAEFFLINQLSESLLLISGQPVVRPQLLDSLLIGAAPSFLFFGSREPITSAVSHPLLPLTQADENGDRLTILLNVARLSIHSSASDEFR
jgi:hypothetical protein